MGLDRSWLRTGEATKRKRRRILISLAYTAALGVGAVYLLALDSERGKRAAAIQFAQIKIDGCQRRLRIADNATPEAIESQFLQTCHNEIEELRSNLENAAVEANLHDHTIDIVNRTNAIRRRSKAKAFIEEALAALEKKGVSEDDVRDYFSGQ